MKIKTSVKKRIFALVGVVVALMSLFTVFVSADDSVKGDYEEPYYIPTSPTYTSVPNYIDVEFGNGYAYPMLFNVGMLIVTEDNDGFYNFEPSFQYASFDDRNIVQSNISNPNSSLLYSATYTTNKGVLSSYTDIDVNVAPGGDDIFTNTFIVSGHDFYVFPRSYDDLEYEFSDGDIIELIDLGDFYEYDWIVKWRFLSNDTVYYSLNTSTNVNAGITIDYKTLLLTGLSNEQLANYDMTIATPIFVESFEIYLRPINVGSLSFTMTIPTLKEVEKNLADSDLDFIYRLGYGTGYNDGNDFEFDLSSLFVAVSQCLAVPIIGGFSIGGLASAFLCLAIVLAVLSLFRGST